MNSPNRKIKEPPTSDEGRKKLSSSFSALMVIIAVSVIFAIITQMHVLDIDEHHDDEVTIDFDSLSNQANNGKDFGQHYIVDTVDEATTKHGNDKKRGSEHKEDSKEQVKEKVTTNVHERMNILILYPDDWRYDSLGSEKPYILTPYLNEFAKEGIRFTHNAVTTSVCWMSRATLFTGQYTSRHRSYKLKCPRFTSPAAWEHSWVKILQKSGYYIGHVGKWQYHTRDLKKLFDWSQMFEGFHWKRVRGKNTHATDLTRERVSWFLDRRPKDKPFALTVAFYPPKAVGDGRKNPETQFQPTNETRKLYNNITIPQPEMVESHDKLPDFLKGGPAKIRWNSRYATPEMYQESMKNYYALISGVDEACGKIIAELKEKGLYNNTMVIFTTDNGMFHGAHGLAGKWYPYQETVRVPLIIYDPRMPAEKVGTLDDSFTLNIDLAETILGAAGVKPDDLMQGRDISDLYLTTNVKNENHMTSSVESEPWREEFFYEFPSPEDVNIPSSTALVRKEWKYINWPTHDRDQLFNLNDDPLELNDLYNNTDPKVLTVINDMRKRHNEMKEDLFDPSYLGMKACDSYKQEG
jgi:arylsulfatase